MDNFGGHFYFTFLVDIPKNVTDISWSEYLSGHRAYIFRPIYSYGMRLDQVTLVSISAVYKPVIVSIPLAHDRICIHSNRRNQCMHIHHLHKVQLTMLHHILVNIQTIRHRHNVHKREPRTKSLRSHIGMQLGKKDRTSSHRRSLTTRRKNWRQTRFKKIRQ